MDSNEFDVTDPLTVDTPPTDVTDVSDDVVRAVLDALGRGADAPSVGAMTEIAIRHLVYLALTSDDAYTLAELATLLADEDACAAFWARLDRDADAVHPQLVTDEDGLTDPMREWLVDVFEPARPA